MSKQEEDLKKEAPILFHIPKKQHFTVPEGYFDKLPAEVRQRVHSEKHSLLQTLQSLLFRPQVAALALSLLLLLAGIAYFTSQKQDGPAAVAHQPKVQPDHRSAPEEKPSEQVSPSVKDERISGTSESHESSGLAEEPLKQEKVVQDFEMDGEEVQLASSVTPREEIDYLLENDIDVSMIIDEM